ncbi:MAG: hypothetical protein KC535_05945 [Nanoarchaeota archaeon]|nr:hypothetical protein [Nanoarchaeota archaeon]
MGSDFFNDLFDNLSKTLSDFDLAKFDFTRFSNFSEVRSKLGSKGAEKFKNQVESQRKKLFHPQGLMICIAADDTKWIYEKQSDIFNSQEADLKAAFGVVCAYDKKLDLASKAFDAIPGKANQIVESRGLIAYERDKFHLAVDYLKDNKSSKYGAIAHSLSLLEMGDTDLTTHIRILNHVKSDLAERIAGILAFNEGDYDLAQIQFEMAWEKNKSEKNLLNLLAAKRHLEENYAAAEFTRVVSSYLIQSGLTPSQNVIDNYIFQSTIPIPSMKLGNKLYKALKIVNHL